MPNSHTNIIEYLSLGSPSVPQKHLGKGSLKKKKINGPVHYGVGGSGGGQNPLKKKHAFKIHFRPK